MFKLEILNHWIVPQQGKNHSEIDEEPKKEKAEALRTQFYELCRTR
jgi:hypothetical protein